MSCLLEKQRIKLELQFKQTRMKPGGHCKAMDKIWQQNIKKH